MSFKTVKNVPSDAVHSTPIKKLDYINKGCMSHAYSS